jgi:hypothetical protein
MKNVANGLAEMRIMMCFPKGTAPHVIEIAKAEIGTIEEGDNLTKYGKFTKADGLPWCGSFCNWVLAQAGVKVHSLVSTATGAHKFREIGRWHEVPALGDMAFMDFPHDGVDRISHIGIVVAIDGKTITTIEGNTSGTGDQRNGGMVMVKQRTVGKEVVGFGRPKYKPYKGEFPIVEIQAPKKAAKPTKEKKTWKK